eukprot:268232-Pyramimonas_sp.AAC.1
MGRGGRGAKGDAPGRAPGLVRHANRARSRGGVIRRRWRRVAPPPNQGGRSHGQVSTVSTAAASAPSALATSLRPASHSSPDVQATRPKPADACVAMRQGTSTKTSLWSDSPTNSSTTRTGRGPPRGANEQFYTCARHMRRNRWVKCPRPGFVQPRLNLPIPGMLTAMQTTTLCFM